jgi:hypothetical protein
MGIAVSASSASRSSSVSAAYTVIALVFFFGIGLAGGTAYKFLSDNDSNEQLADQFTPPPAAPALPQTVAQSQQATAPAPSMTAADAAPLAHLTPTAPPALAMPPAPTPDTAAMAAPPASAPAVPAPEIQAAPLPYAAVTPAQPAPVTAAPPRAIAQHRAAPTKPAKQPRFAAKPAHAVPVSTVAIHEPPAAPGNVAGPFFVQFGAFANEENARRMQWAVEATGLKVEVTQAPGASGPMLYYLRSPIYHDYASALSAAQTVQSRVQHFVNAIPVDYAILGDHATLEQQAAR